MAKKYRNNLLAGLYVCLVLCISACGSGAGQSVNGTSEGTAVPTTPNQVQIPGQYVTPTPSPTLTPSPRPAPSPQNNYQPAIRPFPGDNGHPLLAFYYSWYKTSTWNANQMSDLPTIQYNSSDDTTIDRQLTWAASAGITGFISSWWGAGDQTDQNFVKLLAHATTLENTTGYHFASSLYFESDAPALSGNSNMISALRYITQHYVNDNHFFHWKGKPVLFFWDPLGNGRTLDQWAYIRSQVDPNNQMVWSAEGVDTALLSVFDGIHLFSGGYWGILHNDMTTVDQGFRSKLDTYNATNHTNKIWAAGVLPGYDDTRIPGRTGTYIVSRNNGATYNQSWTSALASKPDWITITSFNEWFEGAMIEPSVTYGTLYLTITQQYAKQWHG